MKKILVLLTIFMLTLYTVNATEGVKNFDVKKQAYIKSRQEREIAFEKRLELTEEQKIKAKEIRIRGYEKIKPVIEEIKLKKQEAKMVKLSRIAVQAQEEKLAVIDNEIKALEKKAHDIRKSNMKEFESILTFKQKWILKQMKNEGRKKYKHLKKQK